MIHDTRRFSVAPVATAEEMAENLSQRTWCRCNGFRLGDPLYLNDSFSEDGAQEFAVVKDGRQIESITFGWCTEATALAIFRRCRPAPWAATTASGARLSNRRTSTGAAGSAPDRRPDPPGEREHLARTPGTS